VSKKLELKTEESEELYPRIHVDQIYPIGSIYMSVNSINPFELFGGVWEPWAAGRVPVGIEDFGKFNLSEAVGGEESTILTVDQLAQHNHSNTNNPTTLPASGVPSNNTTANQSANHNHTYTTPPRLFVNVDNSIGSTECINPAIAEASRVHARGGQTTCNLDTGTTSHNLTSHNHTMQNHTHTLPNPIHPTNNEGANQAHNNLQPYIVCYMWKRVA